MANRINKSLEARFSSVFSARLWGDGESASGPGSSSDSPMVIEAMHALETAYQDFGVRSIADIPCGDFSWIVKFLNRHPDVQYVGFDIVEDLVAQNSALHTGRQFEHFDIVSDAPEKFDLVFTKELLIHLRYTQIFDALRNMKASGSSYLLASNSFGVSNAELTNDELGYARPVDLCALPFNFPKPLWQNSFYALWEMSELLA